MVAGDPALTAGTGTPTGPFRVTIRDGKVIGAGWGPAGPAEDPLLSEALAQVAAYFDRRLTSFDLPLAPGGSGLGPRVWAAMQAIPFGATRTYGALARELGAPAQAIGQACGANPIALFIPCHRITGTGRLGGFSGASGPETKAALLAHEEALLL